MRRLPGQRASLSAGVLLALLALSGGAGAELLTAGRLPMSYRSWTIKADSTETRLSQLHLPVVGSVKLGENADLVVSTSYASSNLEPETSESISLGSSAGLKAQIFLRLIDNRLLLQVGTNVPAGGTGLALDELTVVQALSSPLLGFRLKHYGQGWNIGGGGALAFPLGPATTFAIGGGFVQRGAYEFLANEDDFQPGTELSASTGLDLQTDDGHPFLRLDATYRLFGTDELGGVSIFEEGDQVELQASGSSTPAPFMASARVRSVIKQENTRFTTAGDTVAATALDSGHSWQLQGDLSYAVAENTRLGATAEWMQFSGASEAGQDGQVIGVGPTFDQRLGSRANLGLRAIFLSGQIDETESFPGVDLTGFEVSFGLSLTPGR